MRMYSICPHMMCFAVCMWIACSGAPTKKASYNGSDWQWRRGSIGFNVWGGWTKTHRERTNGRTVRSIIGGAAAANSKRHNEYIYALSPLIVSVSSSFSLHIYLLRAGTGIYIPKRLFSFCFDTFLRWSMSDCVLADIVCLYCSCTTEIGSSILRARIYISYKIISTRLKIDIFPFLFWYLSSYSFGAAAPCIPCIHIIYSIVYYFLRPRF